MPRYLSEQRRAVAGHVVVQFVDDNLKRRTIAVPFHRSDAASIEELITHVIAHAPLRPPHLDESGD